MTNIAEETGLSKGSFYLDFKSNDDMIFAFPERIFDGGFSY
jgi:AcrR family transcriptional regulator